MKIAVVETHWKTPSGSGKRTSAIDYYRSISPLVYAGKQKGWTVDIIKGLGDKPSVKDYARLKEYDFVWLSYLDNSIALKYLVDVDVPYSMDFDDDIINIDETNPVSKQYVPNSQALNTLIWAIKHVPHVTVSTPHLKKAYSPLRKDLTVIRNAVEVGSYKIKPKLDHDKIIIGYMGGITHYADVFYSPFWGALNYLFGKYQGKIALKVLGMVDDLQWKDLEDFRYTSGTNDVFEYRNLMTDWMRDVDIAVAPLHNTFFNKSKSAIKAQEYSVFNVPVVASKIEPYLEYNRDSLLLCEGHRDWVNNLELLINSKEQRDLWGKKALARVNQVSLEKKWTKWADYIEGIVNQRRFYLTTQGHPDIKIVQFRSLFFGGLTGSELYFLDLAHEYIKRGIEVWVLADELRHDVDLSGINIGFNPKASIIHSQQAKPTEHACTFNIPVVQTIHSEVLPQVEYPITHKNIKAYIAVRPTIEAGLLKQTNKPIYTIFNGVDPNLFYRTDNDNGQTLFVGKDDHLRHETLEELKRRGNLLHLTNTDQKKIAEATRDCHQTASIMLGRTTIEGWLCGKPGIVFNVDQNGKIRSEKVFNPPKDLTPFTIEYMADKTLEVYRA